MSVPFSQEDAFLKARGPDQQGHIVMVTSWRRDALGSGGRELVPSLTPAPQWLSHGSPGTQAATQMCGKRHRKGMHAERAGIVSQVLPGSCAYVVSLDNP